MNNSARVSLAVAVVPGKQVVGLEDNPTSRILGVTANYCVCQLGDTIWVERGDNLAIAGIRPTKSDMPVPVVDNDRLDASARLLSEFALLKSLGRLTPVQRAAMED